MKRNLTYEDYPIWIPILSISIAIIVYAVGAYILSRLVLLFGLLYIIYCLGIEFNVILRSCKNCYYYGKICGIGKGKIAPVFCSRGDSKKFTEDKISRFDLLPDFLVAIIPLIGGIISLIMDFSWIILVMLIVLIFLFFVGTAIIRGSLVCRYCRQSEIGCPALELFEKKDVQTQE